MYQPDILPHFSQMPLSLPDDAEGKVLCTLVKSDNNPNTQKSVLYIHGFVDYFFQTQLAQYYLDQNINFYALDLRKSGRSILPGQTLWHIDSIDDYFEDLDVAIAQIKCEQQGEIHLNGHSTGALALCLYVAARPEMSFASLCLNSPFVEMNKNWLVRKLIPVVCSVAGIFPKTTISTGFSKFYAHSLLQTKHGEWLYNLDWKPIDVKAVRLTWLRAIHRAQVQLQAGLHLSLPILLMHSSRSAYGKKWSDDFMRADTVLNVNHMIEMAPRIGKNIRCVAFDGGLHDLILSDTKVREKVFAYMTQWLNGIPH